MASQPCDKCGIDVDPDIQDSCPNCGRKIKGAASPVGWEPTPWEDSPSVPDIEPGLPANYETRTPSNYETLPPPPPPPTFPPEQQEERKPNSFLNRIGIRVALGLVFFAGISAWNATQSADQDEPAPVVDQTPIATLDMEVGDCLLDPAVSSVEQVEKVDCTEAHDLEVFYSATVGGNAYPSDQEFEEAVGDQCIPAFNEYTGEDYEFSDLWIGYFFPQKRSWVLGDKTVECYFYLEDARLIGSQRNG